MSLMKLFCRGDDSPKFSNCACELNSSNCDGVVLLETVPMSIGWAV